jgi:hypothetical protein
MAQIEVERMRLRIECDLHHAEPERLVDQRLQHRATHPSAARAHAAPPCGRCGRRAADARWRSLRPSGHRARSRGGTPGRAGHARSPRARPAPPRRPRYAPASPAPRPRPSPPPRSARPSFDDLHHRARRHELEQLDDVVVAHAHAAVRARQRPWAGRRRCRAGRCSAAWCRPRHRGCAQAPRRTATGCATGSSRAPGGRPRTPPSTPRRSACARGTPHPPVRPRRCAHGYGGGRAACTGCRCARPHRVRRSTPRSGGCRRRRRRRAPGTAGRGPRGGAFRPPACARGGRRRSSTTCARTRRRAVRPRWWRDG